MRTSFFLIALALPSLACTAQDVQVPPQVTAGSALNLPTTGSGNAHLYIVGPEQALRRDVQLGQPISFAAGELNSAGHYLAILVADSSAKAHEFDVAPSPKPASLGFLAKPSRLPVSVHNGISGTAYVFDPYRNLITTPLPVTLELSGAGGISQARTVTSRNGLAWTTMDSAPKQSAARFTARAGQVSSTRIIDQVPGEPCSISINAKPNAGRLDVQTAPIHDCSGNAVADGTIVTFTETTPGSQSTVDVPIKQGIARVLMPAARGARISVASGVVAGNEIRWDGGQ